MFIIALALSMLACTVYDIFGVLGEDGCEMIGGTWRYGSTFEDYCGPPSEDSRPSDEAQDGDGAPPAQEACNATEYLLVTSEIQQNETFPSGTRHCNYYLYITNAHPDTPVWLFIYQHYEEGRWEMSDEWKSSIRLTPGMEEDWYCYVAIPEGDAPHGVSVAKRIAGIFDRPECGYLMEDDEYREEISVPVESRCPTQ
jgi:hypothetical protein